MAAKSAVPVTGKALEDHRAEVRAGILSRGKKVWRRDKNAPFKPSRARTGKAK